MVNCSGKEFKAFISDTEFWGDKTYYDDAQLCVDDVLCEDGIDVQALSDASIVSIRYGYVFHPTAGDEKEPSIEDYFSMWKSKQTTSILVVSCPKQFEDIIKAAIVGAGGTVLTA